MKVLSIGQIPKEVGGSYTTGIARVVYELSKQNCERVTTYLYSTNIREDEAKKLSKYPCQYMGYKIDPLGLIYDWIKHPIKMIKRFKHYKFRSHNNPIRYDFMRYNFERAIKQIKPDLIHMHGNGLDSLYFANEGFGVPILLTLHGVFWDGDDSDVIIKDKLFNNVPFADYYTGLNQECKRRMLNLNIPKDKITLIPNGVDINKFYFSEKERQKLRADYTIPTNRLVFITVGTVCERKGQLPSIRLLETLGIDYEYWIIGTGPYVGKIKSYIEKHHLSDRIKLIGYVNDTDLYKYLSAADVYLHASDMEGQALSEIEAYSTGLRVVVNKKISNTVVGDIDKDDNIYFVLDYDNPSITSLREWLKNNNDHQSRTNFSWANIARRYERLYISLIDTKVH